MNKDVIYIEPEDDITDIITKTEKSKEKIVALVPPKKAGVFRSIVNIKLIAKTGSTAGKTIVLVTTDPAIMRLAAAAKLPVTKNLQSAPSIPKVDDDIVESTKETAEVEDKTDDEKADSTNDDESATEEQDAKASEPDTKDTDDDSDDEEDDEQEDDTKAAAEAKKPKREPKKSKGLADNKVAAWFQEHKKLAISGGVGALLLVLFLVWAFVIAPAVDVTISIRTTKKPFSENVTFTTTLSEENSSSGRFYLDEKKESVPQEVTFEATGKKNVGERAHGEVIVIASVSSYGGTKTINEGDLFTISGLSYAADESLTLKYDGSDESVCVNAGHVTIIEFRIQGCQMYGKVSVTAVAPGAAYNIAASQSGWDRTLGFDVYTESPMTGGTDQEITVVQQSDIDKAKESLTTTNADEEKTKLKDGLGDNAIPIDSSFSKTTSDAETSPKLGEEVKAGEKATLKVTTTTSIKYIDKTKVENYITEKVNLPESQKIYEMMSPFIESFVKTETGYSGKLKTTYLFGPKITETSIVEMIKGKGLGDAQHILKDIEGVSEVKLNPSFGWVMSVPEDTNRITVNIEVKDQDGNPVDRKTDDNSGDNKSEDTANSNDNNNDKMEGGE